MNANSNVCTAMPGANMDRVVPFRPHPLFFGPHRQTIAGLLLPGQTPRLATRRIAVELSDGDRLAIHLDEPREHATDRVAILIHGLAGCHASGYVSRTASKLVANGFTAVRADLRGCGAGWNWAREAFHAGRSSDLRELIHYVLHCYPDASLYLIGFSLGGHLVLKYLGEEGAQVPAQLRGALAVAPPLDLAHCSEQVRISLAGFYDKYFAMKLWRHYRMRMKAGLLPDVRVGHPKSLVEFDHRVTAPLAGFQSVHHYYAAASSYHCLQEIRLPTDIITAADDPMIPIDMVRSAPMPACMRLHVVAAGGHLGFLGDRVYPAGGSRSASLSTDRRWLDWQIVAWAQEPTSFACDAQ